MAETPKERPAGAAPSPEAEGTSTPPREEGDKTPPRRRERKASKKRAASAPRPPGARAATVLALLGLLLLAALAGLGYWEGQRLRAELERRPTDADLDARLEALAPAQAVERLGQRLQDLEARDAKLASQLADLRAAFADLKARAQRRPLAWRVAEAEYLLVVAGQRLALERDVTTARRALEDADARLRVLGDPSLQPVREAIARELAALEAVPQVDVAGMAAALGALAAGVERLPLAAATPPAAPREEAPAPAPAQGWRALAARVWEDLKSLVVIRRAQGPARPLLPPDQTWYLRANLRLALERARLALLRGEEAAYGQALDEAREWLEAYFAPSAPAVAQALEELGRLRQVRLRPPLPALGEALRRLRQWEAQALSGETAP